MKRIENLTVKSITEFVPGDTIYISKMVNRHQFTHLCRFVSYEKGMVTGDVLSFRPDWAHHNVDVKRGMQIRARLAKCYLWGRFPSDVVGWLHCHWFDGKTKKVSGVE